MKRTVIGPLRGPTHGGSGPTRAIGLALIVGAGLTGAGGRDQAPAVHHADPAGFRDRVTAADSVVPGITVLLEDSVALVRGKRVALLTNQTGVDRSGVSDVTLLTRSPRAVGAGVQLVVLYSPEHGPKGTEDHPNVGNAVDSPSGLPVYSLYGVTAMPPPDSTLRRADVLLVDLQDVGTRTWTYVASMVYAVRAAARVGMPVIVLDRPNPLTGVRVEGPVLDSALANATDSPPQQARPFALGAIPLRHGLTMGELARYYDETLKLGAALHVIPVRGWHREAWFNETGLPWVQPSPNLPSLVSVQLYPALVAFEGTNLSVGRGTPHAFQEVGAPWLDARRLVTALTERALGGVRFDVDSFVPDAPTDGKFAGQRVHAVRIVVFDREQLQTSRVAAAILWAVARVNHDSLRVDTAAFDLRFGSPAARTALLRGDDPDAVISHLQRDVSAWEKRARRFALYRWP